MENFDKQDRYFIFPSEITASFWRIQSLDGTGKAAVRFDRFLSWDTFKERYFSLKEERTPVNRITRTLFTTAFLEKNRQSRGSLLSFLVPPEYSENSAAFKGLLLTLLPRISILMQKIQENAIPFPGALMQDLVRIHGEYTGFLKEHDLFEPGWLKADISGLEGMFYLFYPEVIEDYQDFFSELSASERIIPVPLLRKPMERLLRFPTAAAEIKWLMKQIKDLLDSGTPVDRIRITLADMEGWRERLGTMAQIRDIPLSFKEGRPVSEFPGARIFRMLSDCIKGGFGSAAMKQLFLHGAVPWKEREKVYALVQFGVEHHCFRNYYKEGKEIDLWDTALRTTQRDDLLQFYRSFKQSVLALSRSKTFPELKKVLQRFITRFLDTTVLESGEVLKEFQFALDSLNSVMEAAALCRDIPVKAPFDIWLSVLDEMLYVPRGNSDGIAVYPYRVAGGIEPLYHFIPGFSQRVSSVMKEDYSFLREDLKTFFTDTVQDFSDPFLHLYMVSGENVVFSMSKESFSGPEIPPSDFVNEGAVVDFKGTASSINDVFDREQAFWSGESSEFPQIVPVMVQGLGKAEKSVFSGKEIDYTKDQISSRNILEAVQNIFFRSREIFRVSSTMLDAFYFCPYAFFLQRVLSLQENQYEISFKDHQLIGRLIHDCFFELFQFIKETTVSFDPGKTGRYREKIPELVSVVMREYEGKGLTMVSPVWEEVRGYLVTHLCTFLDVEAENFPYFTLESAEETYDHTLEDCGVRIEGRIDRISVHDDRRCIVDYKKNYTTSPSRLNPEEGVPESFQLFFYILLAESRGEKVSSASYYNVTRDRYVTVFSDPPGKHCLSRDRVDEITEQMKTYIVNMKNRLQSGDFSREDCRSCSFRNVCRVQYTVR